MVIGEKIDQEGRVGDMRPLLLELARNCVLLTTDSSFTEILAYQRLRFDNEPDSTGNDTGDDGPRAG